MANSNKIGDLSAGAIWPTAATGISSHDPLGTMQWEIRRMQDEITKAKAAMEGTQDIGNVTFRRCEDGYLVQVRVVGHDTKTFIAETMEEAMQKAVAGIVALRLEPKKAQPAPQASGMTVGIAATPQTKAPTLAEQVRKGLLSL